MATATQQTPNLADPQIAAVREQLAQVLSSPEFSTSERSRQLIRFLVEAALTGNADNLKEYAIGLEVFERNSDHDPRIDSTLRVQVSKLRERLKDYFGEPQRRNGLRIDAPKGGYAPVFFFTSPEHSITPRPSRRPTIAWIAAPAVALGALIGVVSAWLAPRTSPDTPESRPLGFHNAELLAIAPNGTAGLLNHPVFIGPPYIGTLATSPAGVITSYGVVISADGDKYAYSFLRSLSNLFLVEGLR